jgi:curved DNA-binding protein CbpA
MTYYEILGLREDASIEDIKNAYRKSSLEYHPDVNKSPNAERIFQLIQKAYSVLSNPEARKYYDAGLIWERKQRKNISNKSNAQPQSRANQSQTVNQSQSKRMTTIKQKEKSHLSGCTASIFIIVFIVIGSYWFTANDSDNSEYSISSAQQGNENEEYKDNRLSNGHKPYASFYGQGDYSDGSLSQITIKNGTDQDAVVLFQDVNTKRIIRNVYVRANNNFISTEIPQGIYEMKASYGNGWNPFKNNGENNPVGGFVLNISYSKAVSSKDYFDMRREKTYSGYNYPTYEVTLHKVSGGNMQTKNITQHDFFN